MRRHQTILSQYALPSTISLSALHPFRAVFIEAGEILGAFITKNLINHYIYLRESSLTMDQFNKIIEKSTEILLVGNNGRKILTDEKGKELVNGLTYDLYKLLFSGANRLTEVFSESTKSLVSLNNLINLSPESLAPYTISLIPYQIYLESNLNYSQALAKNISKVSTEVWGVRSDIIDNLAQISLRNGEEFAKYKYSSPLKTENQFTKASESNDKFKNLVNSQIANLERAIDIFYFGYKFITHQVALTQIPLIKNSATNANEFLSSSLKVQIDSTDLLLAKERVFKVFEIISHTNNNAKHTSNEFGRIIFKDYSLMLDDKVLVKVDYFEFVAGKRYAITGASGCGKTSVLIDLKEGVFGALSSSGEISAPYDIHNKTKIMFVDQKLYLPKHSSLLETIYFPNILNLLNNKQTIALRKQVIELLKELHIDRFINNPDNKDGLISRLDSQEFKLSGGQEKKLAVIQAIMNKPTILIMDETFSGLDRDSLVKVQKAIIKYLPYTTILSVDHHAEDNNYNGFYHSEVHFEDNKIVERPIVPKIIEELMVSHEATENWNLYANCPLEDTMQCLIENNPFLNYISDNTQ